MFLGEKELEKLQIEGGIQVKYQNYILNSEEAVYFPDRQRIVMSKRTTVTGGGFEMEGSRMEVELETKLIRLIGSVKTKIEPEKLAKKNKQSGASQMSGG
jgi:lipopolysaccharide export system protein LptC